VTSKYPRPVQYEYVIRPWYQQTEVLYPPTADWVDVELRNLDPQVPGEPQRDLHPAQRNEHTGWGVWLSAGVHGGLPWSFYLPDSLR